MTEILDGCCCRTTHRSVLTHCPREVAADIWLMDFAGRKARLLVTAGGLWSAVDFSPDGQCLLVMKYVSAAESYPGEVDLTSGELTLFPVDGGKAAFGDFRYAPEGRSVYFISDEPIDGQPQEFRTLRSHDPASGIASAGPGNEKACSDAGLLRHGQDRKTIANR